MELGKLTNLWYLQLRNNDLTGGIPGELGKLANLENLDVSKNTGMSGELPASLMDLSRLEVLLAEETGLCAPSDREFQDWLAGLTDLAWGATAAGEHLRYQSCLSDPGRTVEGVSGSAGLGR